MCVCAAVAAAAQQLLDSQEAWAGPIHIRIHIFMHRCVHVSFCTLYFLVGVLRSLTFDALLSLRPICVWLALCWAATRWAAELWSKSV